jgi:phenol 2-monooxygenase
METKKTDVLIVGSGSAGIFAGAWLSLYNVPFTILERRSGPLEIGQADGVQCRTVEIYESFGVSEELLRESYHVLEVAFWGQREDGTGIERKSRTLDTEKGLSHMPHVILNQARMNGLMLGVMERERKGHGKTGQGVEYGYEVKSVTVDKRRASDPAAHCVKVVAEKEGKEEVWEAKYVLVSQTPPPTCLLEGVSSLHRFIDGLTGLRRCSFYRSKKPWVSNGWRHQ